MCMFRYAGVVLIAVVAPTVIAASLDQIKFISNDRLREVLSKTTATGTQVDAAVQINTDARLRALNSGC
jgi:hypothetical protein